MVQYVITPWRNLTELLQVRSQLYDDRTEQHSSSSGFLSAENEREELNKVQNKNTRRESDDGQSTRTKEAAVARIRVWMQRGNCPHLVESTAILTSALLNDGRNNETYCVRAVYAAAFCRFVTGLLDCHQDKRHKLSMYALAKTINLPATFVELRHQVTHEELPSLSRLRLATQKALKWIWDFYWVNLPEGENRLKELDDCDSYMKQLLLEIGKDENQKMAHITKALTQWPKDRLLDVLFQIQGSTRDINFLLRVTQLQSMILNVNSITFLRKNAEEVWTELKNIKHDLAPLETIERLELRHSGHRPETFEVKGWVRWEGPWAPKPIGMV